MNANTINGEEKSSYDRLEKLSALIDGELNDISAEELDALLDDFTQNDDAFDMWQNSHMMRDVINGDYASELSSSNSFLSKFNEAFENEPTIIAPHVTEKTNQSVESKTSAQVLSFQEAKQKQLEKQTSSQETTIERNKKHPIWSLALAASVALMTISGLFFKSSEEPTIPLPMTASNQNNLQMIEQNMNHQLVSMTENIKKANEQDAKNKNHQQASSIYLPNENQHGKSSSFQNATYKGE